MAEPELCFIYDFLSSLRPRSFFSHSLISVSAPPPLCNPSKGAETASVLSSQSLNNALEHGVQDVKVRISTAKGCDPFYPGGAKSTQHSNLPLLNKPSFSWKEQLAIANSDPPRNQTSPVNPINSSC